MWLSYGDIMHLGACPSSFRDCGSMDQELLLHLALMTITHLLFTAETINVLCPLVHMLIAKKISMNEPNLLKHSAFMKLLCSPNEEDSFIALSKE